MSAGLEAPLLITGDVTADTEEGLHYPTAVTYYARIRFIVNLLPLIQRASALRRVVTVLAATKEGPIDTADFQARHVPLLQTRGHLSSMMTLALESLALEAPDVSFIHSFPGSVKTNLGRDARTAQSRVMRAMLKVVGPLVNVPLVEAGERQVFLATSGRFPPGMKVDPGTTTAAHGVPVPGGVLVSRGSNGEDGSGVYSIGMDGEPAWGKPMEILQNMRDDDVVRKLWLHTEEVFTWVTGARFV